MFINAFPMLHRLFTWLPRFQRQFGTQVLRGHYGIHAQLNQTGCTKTYYMTKRLCGLSDEEVRRARVIPGSTKTSR